MPSAIPPVPVATSTHPASASISLRKIANWDGRPQNISQVLNTAFEASDYLDCIKDLRGQNIDPPSYINNLDKVSPYSISNHRAWFVTVCCQIIDTLSSDLELQKRCIRALRKTCGLYGILPASYTVTSALTSPGQRAFASGGFSDVWRLTDENNHDLVFAVKSLRVYEQDPFEKINKVWRFSVHDRITD